MSLIKLLQNTLRMRCPRCHRGHLFKAGPFAFNSQVFEMHDQCAVCGQDFLPEPGFYYGSMFLSYIGTGIFSIIFVAIVHWVFGWSLTLSFVLLIAVLALMFGFVFQFARSLWINMVVSYDPKWEHSRDH